MIYELTCQAISKTYRSGQTSSDTEMNFMDFSVPLPPPSPAENAAKCSARNLDFNCQIGAQLMQQTWSAGRPEIKIEIPSFIASYKSVMKAIQ